MKFQIYGGVKIKALNILLGLFLVLLMVPMVSAQTRSDSVGDNSFPFNESFLIITDVDVKVCNDRCKTDKDLRHGNDIGDEAEPGGTVEFDIEVANIFPVGSDIEIEDIEVEITIFDIDDGDDLDADDEIDDLRDPGDDDNVRISFDIPLEVEDDTFDVLIEIDGSSKNGTQRAQMELTLEVQKEDNEVRFTRNTLTPSEVKCSRTVQLSTGVINTGTDDEDDTILEIENAELGVSIRETFDLSNDPFDDDSKFSKTYTFTVPDVAQGIYSLLSRVTFNNGRDVETETADLVVGTCETLKPVVEEEEEEEEEEEKEDVVVVKPPVTTTPTVTTPTIPTGQIGAVPVTTPRLPTTEEESFFESSTFLVVLIAGEVLLVLIAILIIFAVARRRRD